jgi:hypothetical protein
VSWPRFFKGMRYTFTCTYTLVWGMISVFGVLTVEPLKYGRCSFQLTFIIKR